MRRLTPDTLRIPEQPLLLGKGLAGVPVREVVTPPDDGQKALQVAFDEARDRGFSEGMKDASREIERRVEAVTGRLRQDQFEEATKLQERAQALHVLSQGMAGAMERIQSEVEAIAVEVAYAALIRLLGAHADKRDLLQAHCVVVMNEFGDPPATLRVSERDLELLDLSALPFPVESDRRLAPGQCTVETARGQFDCGLDVRLEAIRHAFLAGLREHQGAKT